MHYVVLVKDLQAVGHTPNRILDKVLSVMLMMFYDLRQIFTFDVFYDNEEAIRVLEDHVQFHVEWTLASSQEPIFSVKQLLCGVVSIHARSLLQQKYLVINLASYLPDTLILMHGFYYLKILARIPLDLFHLYGVPDLLC